jgi:hypothetical protein
MCGEALDLSKGYNYMRTCAQTAALARPKIEFESYLDFLPETCKWEKSTDKKPKTCTFSPLSNAPTPHDGTPSEPVLLIPEDLASEMAPPEDLATQVTLQLEMQKRLCKNDFPVGVNSCRRDSCTQKFNDRQEQLLHALHVHAIVTGTTDAKSFIAWCPFCEVYIFGLPLSTDREKHFATHIEDATQHIRDYAPCRSHHQTTSSVVVRSLLMCALLP